MNRTLKYIKNVFLLSVLLFSFFGFAYSSTEETPPFRLLATVIEAESEQSICVIMNLASGEQKSCKVLDKFSGYQIVKIIRGRVKLLQGGKVYVLDFPLGNENKTAALETITLNRAELLNKLPGPNLSLMQALPIPCIESGKIIGFKIPVFKDKSLLEMSGLKEGDVATRVNGERLDSIQKALEFYHRFKNQERIEVEVKRGDAVKNLTYQIN